MTRTFRKNIEVSVRCPSPQHPVSLRWLFPRSSFVGCADILVNDVTENSRECVSGITFAAISGTKHDGSTFVSEAIRFGAQSLLVEHPLPNASVPQCVVPNVRRAYSILCETLYGCPSRKMSLVGVTGTNGKTTTTWLVHSILKKSGRKSGLLGTVEYCDGEHREPAPLTTPDSKSFSRWLCRMRDRGVVSAAVELSSHALHQCRVAGAELRVAVVTNLTQDHFDYHGDFASYRNSKLRIFEQLQAGGVAILNADDPQVVSMAAEIGDRHPVVTYGLDSQADCTAAIVHESLSGSQIELNLMGERIAVQTSLVGRHNVSNCLAAAAAARAVGLSPDEIAIGLGALDTVPGRLERIDAGQPFSVFVDYAHTDDALRRCIRCLKRMADGRVICVFGAGGDRDRTKRPLLGKAASEADVAIVTSDNPRTESPGQIIDDILSGISTSVLKIVEEDRARAIHRAIDMARSDDCVLIAGKGHERFQILGTKRVSFDDREIAKTALRNLKQPVGISSDRISA